MDIPDMSDLVPELICLGVDAVICGILYKVYSDTNSTIEAVKVSRKIYFQETVSLKIACYNFNFITCCKYDKSFFKNIGIINPRRLFF